VLPHKALSFSALRRYSKLMRRAHFGGFAASWIMLLGLAVGVPACGTQVELPQVCPPNVREVCYDGPAETLGIGRCRAGLRSCLADGSGFGSCEGAILPAPEVCGADADEDCNGKTDECTGDVIWAQRWYGDGYSRSMSADGLGNVVIGIEYKGNFDLSAPVGTIGSASEYGATAVVKVNAKGETEFARVVDGGALRETVSVDKAGNVAAAGSFPVPITLDGETFYPTVTQDIFFFLLNSAGDVQFRKQFPSTGDCYSGIIDSSPSGDIVLSGDCYYSSIDLGGGTSVSDTFIARFSAAGELVYAKDFASVNIAGTSFDGHGNVILSGWFYDQANFGGPTLESSGTGSSFLVKLGPAGEHIWSKQLTETNTGGLYLYAQPDLAGNVYVAATFEGTVDFGGGPITSLSPPNTGDGFLMKLDPKGDYLWGKHFGNGASQSFYALTVDASGNVTVVAEFDEKIDFGAGTLYAAAANVQDIAIAKFTPEGKTVWSRRFGAGNIIYAPVIAAGPLGEIFLAGTVFGDIDFGTGVLPAKTYAGEMFVVKLAP